MGGGPVGGEEWGCVGQEDYKAGWRCELKGQLE